MALKLAARPTITAAKRTKPAVSGSSTVSSGLAARMIAIERK